MELSIIIPVYNVVKWLERCVLSVVSQGLVDYEVILVDDGSTDGSGALCDELCHQYESLKVIHQPNGGLSAARNAGMAAAKGRYITFVDSDDELCPNTLLENLECLLRNPEVDMLEYPIEVHAGSADAHTLAFSDETQSEDVFFDWISRGGYVHCYACNKIYRASVWNELRFPIGEYFEDVSIMPTIIRCCRSIHYSSHGCYRYVMHSGSITTSYCYHKLRALFQGNYRLFMEIKDVPKLQNESLLIWVYCLNQLIDMGRCADADRVEYFRIVADVEKHHPSYTALLVAAPNAFTRIKLLPLLVLGLASYCRLYIALTKTLHP